MNQKNYIIEVLKHFNIEECKPVRTLLGANSKLLKLLDEGFENMPPKNGRYSIQGWRRISHICNGRYVGRCYICGEYGEPIHVGGQSTILDGYKTHHEIFKRHFGIQIMPWRQGYCLEKILRCELGEAMQTAGDPQHGMCFLLALESFYGNARNNQPLHCLRWRWSTWLLAIARRKWFGLGNFWQVWDMCKKDPHPSCVTTKDA